MFQEYFEHAFKVSARLDIIDMFSFNFKAPDSSKRITDLNSLKLRKNLEKIFKIFRFRLRPEK